jgi:hypothetical protein
MAAAGLSLLAGCSSGPQLCVTGDEDSCDAGGLPDDPCNSKDDALGKPECQLTVGVGGAAVTPLEGYISTQADGGRDVDWYSAAMPANLTARSLLHVSAGYTAPQTAVNLQLNVLKGDGSASIASGVDTHGAAAPAFIDIVQPYSDSSATLLFLLSDSSTGGQVKVDNKNAYSLSVEVIDNPDQNEPNDTTPTQIPLAASGGISEGTTSGYLATVNDVDQYAFTVTGSARQIIYVHVSSTMANLNPPLPYRLSYTLFDPSKNAIAEGVMANAFLQVELASAHVAPAPGTYTLVVQGYHSPNSPDAPVLGDLRLKYDVDVKVMNDLDPNEPNDTWQTAKAKTLALDVPSSVSGRLASVPDEDWYEIDLPANAQPTVLRYKAAVSTTAGRYAPLSATPSRQLRLVTQVTQGSTTQDRLTACKTDRGLCPRGDEGDISLAALADELCASADPPHCLWAERGEVPAPYFPDLKNLDGAIPVPPHSSTVKYLLLFHDVGNGESKYADDRDYTINLTWESDPDEALRASGPMVSTLGTSPSTASGDLSHGYGRILGTDWDVNTSNGARGPSDYDAVPTDKDLFRFDLPSTPDLAWNISWEVDHGDAGSAAGELTLDVTLCQSAASSPDGGSCVGTTNTFAFSGKTQTPWYLPTSYGNSTVLFTKSVQATKTVVTAEPIGCWCFGSGITTAGHIFVNVGAANRTRSDKMVYRVIQSVGTYPQSYTKDGGQVSCPAVSDGGVSGCGFGG